MQAQWILLVLEDGLFPDEGICCAVKLAKRMNCSVSILMLPGAVNIDDTKETDIQSQMDDTIKAMVAEGVHAEGNFIYGDKASAFLKHLAMNPSLKAIVWGSNGEIETKTKKKKAPYWFTKVKSSIQCPVVRPELKTK